METSGRSCGCSISIISLPFHCIPGADAPVFLLFVCSRAQSTVNPERPDLVETRTIGGVRYLLIKADEGVELNGIDLAEDA